jgi:hypothetical protein
MPTKSPAAPTLQQLVAKRYPHEKDFSAALINWFNRHSSQGYLPFDDQPEIAKAIWTLDALVVSLSVSGATHFLMGMGSQLRRLGDYARLVGAPVTEAFAHELVAEVKRLGRGKLPAETSSAVASTVHGFEQRDMAAGGEGLFLALDDEYSGAVIEEIEARLRPFVKTNATKIVEAFDSLVRPAAVIGKATATGPNGERYFSDDFRAYDARVREWSARASKLPESAWEEVAKRHRKTVAFKADWKITKVWSEPRFGRTLDDWKVERKKTSQRFIETEQSVKALLDASSLPPKTRIKATEAHHDACRALAYLPELERYPDGLALIETMLAPFEGFIPPWDSSWG